ncbi:DMT family transporter [Treponema primitia]|uniref:DMT family transporter n=1 Tax=Treponema primitia TaxID=88058 RepID=UPI00025551E8|nr:DMT family transporter [Treponema primitia]
MNKRNNALLAIILCVLFWGFSFISIKVSVAVIPPMTLGVLRFAIALVFLVFIKQKIVPGEKLKLRDLPLLAGAGIFGVTIYFFCENNGVSLVSASEASIIIASIPVLTLVVERIFGRVKYIALWRWLGAAVSIAGVWLVAGVSFSVSGSILGYIYMGGAALCWVAYCFLTRPLFTRCSRIHIVFWQTVFGFIGFIPFSLAEHSRWAMPGLPVILHVVFLGICCSALGYWLYAQALEVLGVSISSIFINFIPVITAIGGFFLLGERLYPIQWAGAALVISGVTLAMIEKKQSPPLELPHL